MNQIEKIASIKQLIISIAFTANLIFSVHWSVELIIHRMFVKKDS